MTDLLPTDLTTENLLFDEWTRGLTISVFALDDSDWTVDVVNRTDTGPVFYVFTKSQKRAWPFSRDLEFGEIGLNCSWFGLHDHLSFPDCVGTELGTLSEKSERNRMGKKRNPCTMESKIQAVEPLNSSGKPGHRIEGELGIGQGTIYLSRRQFEVSGEFAVPGNGNERDKEFTEAREEREVLREAYTSLAECAIRDIQENAAKQRYTSP